MKKERLSKAFNSAPIFERDLIKIALFHPWPPLLLLTVVCSISQGLGSSDGNIGGVAYYRFAHGSPPSFYLSLLSLWVRGHGRSMRGMQCSDGEVWSSSREEEEEEEGRKRTRELKHDQTQKKYKIKGHSMYKQLLFSLFFLFPQPHVFSNIPSFSQNDSSFFLFFSSLLDNLSLPSASSGDWEAWCERGNRKEGGWGNKLKDESRTRQSNPHLFSLPSSYFRHRREWWSGGGGVVLAGW